MVVHATREGMPGVSRGYIGEKAEMHRRPEPHDLDAVVETVRSIWTAAGQSDPQVRTWLQKTVVDGVDRIKRQVQGKLKIAAIMATPRQTS